MGDDRLWITPIVRMEILYSARSTSEYTAVETERDTHFDKLAKVLTFGNVELPAS